MTELNLKLLGYPEVHFQGARLKLPTQKVQAIVYYLAIKRQASREELAELLWDVDARHRLRPELYRLRNQPGAGAWLNLDETAVLNAQTDLAVFESCVRMGQFQKAIGLHPENALLLQGFSLDDADPFMDWLELERLRVTRLYREALRGWALELARQDQIGEALDVVRQSIELDPLDESAYRTAMRLEYSRGHTQAALQHFDHCRRALAEELGIEPLEETLVLAAEIQKGSALPESSQSSKKRLPKAFLRPPSLIARETEWARMETAFQNGQVVFISGPAGSGKTRLMLDFARSKGDVVMAEGRIGDANIPLSTMSRVFRNYIEAFPDRPPEPWVKQELSRFLGTEDSLAASLNATDKTRLYQAVEALFQHAGKHLRAFPTDNMHYFDPLSAEVSNQVASVFFGQRTPERTAINTFRRDAMPPPFWQFLDHLIAQGIAIHIELQPLDLEGIGRLLDSLGLENNNNLAAKLHRLTGGNPQFVIETLKSLHVTDQLDNVPERITLPERLAFVLRKRLDGLSTLALRIAKAVATLETIMSTDTLAELLELNSFDVAEGIAELEETQIFAGNQFVHDLLQETTKRETPAAVQRLLHKRMAVLLEQQNQDSARIAHHFQAADEREKALPWRLKAIEDALCDGFRDQAAQWLEPLLFEAPEDSKTYAQALLLKGRLLLAEDVVQAEACFRESFEQSKYLYPEIEVSALAGLAQCERHKRRFKEATALVDQALGLPLGPGQKAGLFHVQGVIHSQSGDQAAAEVAFQKAIQEAPEDFNYRQALAILRWHQGRFTENAELILDLLRRKPELAKVTLLYHNIGAAYWSLGQARHALEWLEKSLKVWLNSGNLHNEAMSLLTTGSVLSTLGRSQEAEHALQHAHALFGRIGIKAMSADADVRLAYLYAFAGRHDPALQHARAALAVLEHHPEPFFQSYTLACLGWVYAMRHDLKPAQEHTDHALQIAEAIRHPLARMIALAAAMQTAELANDPDKARAMADTTIHLAHTHQTLAFLARAQVFRAGLTADHTEATALARVALATAQEHGLAFVARDASAFLCRMGFKEFESEHQSWQMHLESNRAEAQTEQA